MVQAALAERGVESELVTYKTTRRQAARRAAQRDRRRRDCSRRSSRSICAKGKDRLARPLAQGSADRIAARTELVAAVLEREDPRDVLVLNRDIMGRVARRSAARLARRDVEPPPSRAAARACARISTSSELRGNVPTRLKKVDEGRVHAAILAAAGLHRLGAHQHIPAISTRRSGSPRRDRARSRCRCARTTTASRALSRRLNDRADDDRRARRACVPAGARGRLPGPDRRARRSHGEWRAAPRHASPTCAARVSCAARSRSTWPSPS